MRIDKKDQGPRVFSAEVGGTEITEALNAVQVAYRAFMGDAWGAPDTDADHARIAARTVAWAVALEAHHMILTRHAPQNIREVFADMVAETYASMLRQIEEAERAAKA